MLRHDDLFLKFLTNYVTINLNVFGSLMEHGISAMCIALLLSPYSLMGRFGGKPIYVNKSLIQTSSNVTFTIALYSDFALDPETTLCFLFFHDTRFLQERQYHVVDLYQKGTMPSLCLKSLLLWCVHDLNREAPFLEVSLGALKSSLPPPLG